MSRQIKKEVRRVCKERSRTVWENEFAAMHELFGKDLETKKEKMAILQQRVVNERELLAQLGSLLDAKESHMLAYQLTDQPFVAKASIFCTLCVAQIRSLVGALGRLGNNFLKGERVADEAAMRLRTYVRNVLYGDLALFSDHDVDGRRRSCLSVAHSQLEQDVAAATDISLEILKQSRSSELNLLMVLASQLLQQRFECERCVERVSSTLDAVCKNFRSCLVEDKREVPGSGRSYKDYLMVEKEKLLNDLAQEVDAFRVRLEILQGLIDAVRYNSSEFVSAVHNGCPFHLRVVNSAAPSSSTTDDDVSGSSEHDGNSGTAAAAALAASSTSWDADVRFWLQSNGLLKHESCFAGVAWTALPLLTAEDLRSRGVGSNDAARARIVQMFLKIDSSDWFNVLFSGFLRKRGEGNKAWRRRYFVLLSNKELLYFKSDSAVKAQGSFFLSHVSDIVEKGRQVALVTKGRTYELEAETQPEYERWIGFFRLFRT